ncbi:hypothetical protein Tco_0627108 [Tanacetum coccineum]|uniref:Uncharacterized protein n=1 Tax=Tanacetum coccineum TaxID=301880 RepID=A0ABQ4WMA0_9ASTR
MSTQQDIYAAGSENRPPMLNKENYVPWSSRLLRYAKSRQNGKLIYNSIMNGPYVRRMIPEPGDADREVPIPETFHEQTDDELTEAEIKQMEADDQAIQTILLGLPEDIYDAVDSCETAREIWLRVQQMMKGSDIGIQEKKAKLFNEWERFTSTDEESIESYYHRFSKLMNDFKRNKHFPEKIASNLKFLNNLIPSTYMQQPQPINNNYNPQPSFNQNYMQQPMPNPEDITDPTTAMNMALDAPKMAKAYRQMQMVGGNGGNQFRQYAGQNVGNQNGYNALREMSESATAEGKCAWKNGNQNKGVTTTVKGWGHLARKTAQSEPRRRIAAYPSRLIVDLLKRKKPNPTPSGKFDLYAADAAESCMK